MPLCVTLALDKAALNRGEMGSREKKKELLHSCRAAKTALQYQAP